MLQQPASSGGGQEQVMRPLTVVAKIIPDHEERLRQTLHEIDSSPADNPYMLLGASETTHFARFVIINDHDNGPRLLFSAEYDGGLAEYLDHLVAITPRLDAIWGNCEDYTESGSFPSFVKAHSLRIQDPYIGLPGLTAVKIKNQIALRKQLEALLDLTEVAEYMDHPGIGALLGLLDGAAGKKALHPLRLAKTALRDFLATLQARLHKAVLGITLNVARAYGQSGLSSTFPLVSSTCGDPAERARYLKHLQEITAAENRFAQNQMTLVADLKPGIFIGLRLNLAMTLAAYVITYGWPEGNFSDVYTLHSFHWAVFDNGKRLLFISNFDGSPQNYLGDFLDKLSWGLNTFYCNCVGYPIGGMVEVEPFYEWIRDHQAAPQVYYSAYPEDTVLNILANQQISRGLAEIINGDDAKEWLRLL